LCAGEELCGEGGVGVAAGFVDVVDELHLWNVSRLGWYVRESVAGNGRDEVRT
jgi:hypothetical protein